VFKFITTKPFWVNLLVAIFLVIAILFSILQLLGTITNHGEYLKVPNVLSKNTNEAIRFLESKGFDVVIQDSIYTDTAKRGIVLKQLPDPNSLVKVNRTIILTVNRFSLPLVDMPALEGKTLNFAIEILKRSHLKFGDTIFRPDFMLGSVIEQQYHGDKIPSGSKVPWGSIINLVVGSGLNDEPMLVPEFIGMTYEQVKDSLDKMGVTLGALVTDADVTDTNMAFIWKQQPPTKNEDFQPNYIKAGQLMDLWISTEIKLQKDTIIK